MLIAIRADVCPLWFAQCGSWLERTEQDSPQHFFARWKAREEGVEFIASPRHTEFVAAAGICLPVYSELTMINVLDLGIP